MLPTRKHYHSFCVLVHHNPEIRDHLLRIHSKCLLNIHRKLVAFDRQHPWQVLLNWLTGAAKSNCVTITVSLPSKRNIFGQSLSQMREGIIRLWLSSRSTGFSRSVLQSRIHLQMTFTSERIRIVSVLNSAEFFKQLQFQLISQLLALNGWWYFSQSFPQDTGTLNKVLGNWIIFLLDRAHLIISIGVWNL